MNKIRDSPLKHWLIAAGDGYNDSVKNIQQLYRAGHATKEDYANDENRT
jgi:hypothetical protein